MYKHYGWKLTCSLAAEAALAEERLDFEIIPINIRADEQLTEEYGRIIQGANSRHLYCLMAQS